MDSTQNSDIDMNSKSFVDLFALMNAKKVTQLRTGKMMTSGFPKFAAELGRIKYELINF